MNCIFNLHCFRKIQSVGFQRKLTDYSCYRGVDIPRGISHFDPGVFTLTHHNSMTRNENGLVSLWSSVASQSLSKVGVGAEILFLFPTFNTTQNPFHASFVAIAGVLSLVCFRLQPASTKWWKRDVFNLAPCSLSHKGEGTFQIQIQTQVGMQVFEQITRAL